MLKLHRAYLAATDQLMTMAAGGDEGGPVVMTSPEAAVHNFFRRNHNHFEALEAAAEAFWGGRNVAPDDVYAEVKAALRDRLGLRVRLVRVEDMPDTLREYDEAGREVLLSEALDHPNRVFQLVHVAGLIENRRCSTRSSGSNISDAHGLARCRVELANYFAAAVLMPYGPYLAEALASKYDFDHLATRFGVSFEQACHRATTLQRSGAQGVPFFFLRIDKAGNVTKRFNATDFPPRRIRRRVPAARRAHLLPRAGADRAAIRRDAGHQPVLRLRPHRGPAFRHAACAGRAPCRRHGLRGGAYRPHRLCRGFRRQPRAPHAHRHQLPHLPADELRPARPQRHGAKRTAGRTPARHHALRKLSRRRVSTRGRHVTPCGVS
jgi:hypothetical protein